MEVWLQIFIHYIIIVLAVIEPCFIVKCCLARIYVKGHRVSDSIKQNIDTGKIPNNCAVNKFCIFRSIFIEIIREIFLGPFKLELAILD